MLEDHILPLSLRHTSSQYLPHPSARYVIYGRPASLFIIATKQSSTWVIGRRHLHFIRQDVNYTEDRECIPETQNEIFDLQYTKRS